MRLTPQQELVLEYMREFGSITQRDGVYYLGISDTRKRISELRRLGYKIVGEKEKGINRRGNKTEYTRYRLEEACPVC